MEALGLKSSIGFLAAALSFAAMARTQAFPPLPDSQFADAESSTNVAFNAVRSDALDFRVEMDFDGSESNCVQIAFGRDADGDGDLAARETALVVGWRAGRYFVEGACGGGRTCEEAAPAFAGRRHLLLSLPHFPFRGALDRFFDILSPFREAGAAYAARRGAET